MRISVVAHDRIRCACAISAVFAASIATKALGFEATPAVARGYSSSFDNDQPRTARGADGYSRSKSGGAASAPVAKRVEINNVERPLFAVISIADQRISIYNDHGLVDQSAISTGMPGHPTPKGVFTIIGRERNHRSNIYSDAPMPFMQRITWSGIAMHLGVVPGHPASHGCIRLPAGFAAKLWGLTKIGERVVISPQDVTPIEFTHALLPAPKMRVEAEAGQSAPDATQTPIAAASPPLINPHQYAEQLRAKAVAERTAAVKTVRETYTAVRAGQQEAARAAAVLKAAETAHFLAQAKAETAANQAAVADESAKEQDSILVAELKAAEGNVYGMTESRSLSKASERAAAATDASALATMNVETALADAEAKLEAAETASAAKAADLADAVRRWNDATAASDAAASAEKEALRRTSPLSVLVSKKNQRIYVRQGLAPIFDAPAIVRDPEKPLGSHLYIATAVESDGTSLKWTVMSIPTRFAEERSERKRKTASDEEQAGAPPKLHGSPSSAADALERIEISEDVRDRIAERLWTGGSLIISDEPLSGETGAVGTDLTVKVR